ncbi:MAG: WYL domain-containing protein [Spirochaetes bacterium]|nr:WYL domain-containing protein [Spirochaetota bacterium]
MHKPEKERIIDPEATYAVIRRCLHIIALLQEPSGEGRINAQVLADILSLDEEGEPLQGKSVSRYSKSYLMEKLGLDIGISRGVPRWEMRTPIEDGLLRKLMGLYLDFISIDYSREIITGTLAGKNPLHAMGILARLYFASVEKRKAVIEYDKDGTGRPTEYRVRPYHLAIKDTELYLICRKEGSEAVRSFVVSKIAGVRTLPDFFGEEPASVEDHYMHSFSAFVGDRLYSFELDAERSVTNTLMNVFGGLRPACAPVNPEDEAGRHTVRFEATDIRSVCKQLFFYGSRVKILGPPEAVSLMREMLDDCRGVYG